MSTNGTRGQPRGNQVVRHAATFCRRCHVVRTTSEWWFAGIAMMSHRANPWARAAMTRSSDEHRIAPTFEVLRLEHERWVMLATFADDARVRAEPFDAIELELGALWADVEPPAP